MKYKTAKTVREFLSWIDTVPHHYAAANPGVSMTVHGGWGGIDIPVEILTAATGMYEPGDGGFMFRVTEFGRKALDTPE